MNSQGMVHIYFIVPHNPLSLEWNLIDKQREGEKTGEREIGRENKNLKREENERDRKMLIFEREGESAQ